MLFGHEKECERIIEITGGYVPKREKRRGKTEVRGAKDAEEK